MRINAKSPVLLSILATTVFTVFYCLQQPQFLSAFRAFVQDPAHLPAFFASDYFSGQEYGYIGNHLAQGHGFVGPFDEIRSPTGTMPPVLPFLYAAIFWCSGFKTVATFWIIFFLKIVTVAAGFMLLHRTACAHFTHAENQGRKNLVIIASIYAVLFATGNLFFFYYDEWIMWFLVALTLYLSQKLFSSENISKTRAMAFGAFIGLLILTQTVAGAALLGAIIFTACRFRRYNFLWVVPAALIITAPWIFRNYLVFNEFMPVKSNLGFELYFSTVHEPRGILILEEQNASRKHPIKPGPEREFALSIGEQEYQRRKTAEFMDILKNEPSRYFKKVAWRLLYATLVFPYSKEEQKVQAPAWPVLKYLSYPVVFLLWFIQWFMPESRRPFVFFLLTLYAAYLLPYIMINFWLKYWVHMLPLYAFIVAIAGPAFYHRFMREEVKT